jgi:O-antigen ligase
MFRNGFTGARYSGGAVHAASAMSALTSVSRVALTLLACAVVAAAMLADADQSAKAAVAVVVGAGLVCGMLWFGGPQKKFLLGLLFLTAPFDISKAVIPPLDRFYSPGLYVTICQAVMLALGLVWGVERVFVKRLRLPFTTLDALALAYLGLVWIGALHAQAGLLAYASAVAYTLCVLGFYVVSHAIETKSDVRVMLAMVIAGFCFQAVYVAAQMLTQSFLTLPGAKVAPVGTQGVVYEAEQVAAFRPIGSFDHPNALADYLTLLLAPALALVLLSRSRLPPRIWTIGVLILVIGGSLLLLTLSRGGWAACLLGGVVVATVYWRKRLIGSGHILVFAGIAFAGVVATVAIFPQVVLRLTEPDARSTESRIVLTDQALTIIKDHPLIGVGYGGYNRAAVEHTPPSFALISEDYQKQLLQLVVHNHYLLIASELGLPVMCYWIFLMLRFVRQAWPLSQWRDPGMFALGVGLAGALASQMLYLASDNYYVDIRIALLWITAGVLQALTLIAARETQAPP